MNNYIDKKNQIDLSKLKSKIIRRGDLLYTSMKDQLNYIDKLSQFPLGQILLDGGSIDTFWTDFIMTHDGRCNDDLEDFLLNRSPFTLSWRELLHNFKINIQASLKNEMILASIPCGAMRELLELDYSQVSNFKLIGIDIDTDSLSLAQMLAKEKGLDKNLSLFQQDAWQLQYKSEIDLITSCGLNIYVTDQEKILNLYRQFFKALKPNGKLIIGFLTYPPDEKMPSEWCIDCISPEDLLLEKILYKDILEAQWRNFRTSEEFENELREAGFSEVCFHYDKLHVFPVVIARK